MDDVRIHELKTLLPRCLLADWVRLGSRLIRLLRDRRHAGRHDALLDRLLQQARASVALREQRRRNVPPVRYPPALPITSRREEIVAAIRRNPVVVIAGETGSGKTTQLPKMCLEAGLGVEAKIGCTQPRRVAALSISRRLAEELNVAWGREVGCKIRFDDWSSPMTLIKLMTDGMLLAETQGDPDLSEYNALILDEAHERSLNIDFLLGYLKGLLARRSDLKLIVTSATIDTEAFSRHFGGAPIIEVSGRLFPVEVRYEPIDPAAEESGEVSYVDAAVLAAGRVVRETDGGDVLIFLPGERDIRETGDQLESRVGGEADIIPLFGRLSAGDQQRVFAASARRKIVVATNIAETSLTIPGIRYVIDAGLARISRYNPRTRTRRLPIEPVSQSSAHQRKGRAGRVRDGVCIRLYSEEDFQARPIFTQPEIQRSNLAEVILRMKAFRLGEIETFPFLQPPAPAAMAGGYALLQELGALDEQRELTPLGRDLARLPIDPTLGRMLLQSQQEHATRELLIIAAGLSIQDPRERPLDQKDAAQAAHRRFEDARSDFLALLNIWNAVHDQWETLRTQNQRRRFCRQQFLSYLRMREWQDLHAQLLDALDDLGALRLNESTAAYDAIHRSILSGLIGHVARRTDRNTYTGAGNRSVMVFPGSALFERSEPPRKRAVKSGPAPRPKSGQPEWIVAGEIVETSQVFARTVAGINPKWIFQLAPHCCQVRHQNPHWNARAGRVLVEEVVTLHGLEVQRREVAYGAINPKDATAIFIQSALVEENLLRPISPGRDDESSAPMRSPNWSPSDSVSLAGEKGPAPVRFLVHNHAVRQKIENWQTRVRRRDLPDLDRTLFDFYARHLENVSSLQELNRLWRGRHDPRWLCISEAELAGGQSLGYDVDAFPDAVAIGGQPVAVEYAYAPGEAHDGVTFKLPFRLAQTAPAAVLEWAVPGLREEKIGALLRALPKALRRELLPFPPKIAEIVREFQPDGGIFLKELARFIRQRYGVEVPASAWPAEAVPAHLRPRIEVLDQHHRTIESGRDLDELRQRLEPSPARFEFAGEPTAWHRAAQQWERFGIAGWTFGDLPERVMVSEGPGLPQYAWPGLEADGGGVNVRLFGTGEAAREASLAGVRRLVEWAIQKDLGWLEKDLRGLNRFEGPYASLGTVDELRESALEHLKRHLLPTEPLPALTEAQFRAVVEEARRRLPGLAQRLIDQVDAILRLGEQLRRRLVSSPSVAVPRSQTLSDFRQIKPLSPRPEAHPLFGELNALLPPRFLDQVPFERLPHRSRHLKALLVRVERAALRPAKDRERAAQLAPYLDALRKLEPEVARSGEARRAFEEFRWMIEEFKVSLFAQELGTAFPVSPKRLDRQLETIRHAIA